MSDERDPIIDSLLDEVLSGEQPPDLTQRILGAHRAMAEGLTVDPITVEKPSRRMQGRKDSVGTGLSWAAAAVVLVGAGLFAAWAWQQDQRFNQANTIPVPPGKSVAVPAPEAIVEVDPLEEYEGQEETAIIPDWADPDRLRKQLRDGRVATADAQQVVDPVPAVQTPEFERLVELASPSSNSQVVAFIDRQLKAGWRKAKVVPTDSVGDLAWLNRATNVLLGRSASQKERAAFEKSRDKEEAIEWLLSQEGFARHWGNRFADILVGAVSRGVDRVSFEAYLADSFKNEKPFDQLAFELITAQGGEGIGQQDNPAVNFLLAHQDGKAPAQFSVTDKVCQVFLGKQMQCVRCHDHPANKKLSQESYWGLASYFAQMRVEKNAAGALLVDRDYAGSDGKSLDEADLFFTNDDEVGAVAYPVFLGQKNAISKSGRVRDVIRRVELANSIVGSDDFAEAAVNRMWRMVFRTGFTQPVDDMGPHKKLQHDELLDGLAREFKNSGYDVRSALRWMLRSAAFDRKVRAKSDPLLAKAGGDAFSSFPRRVPFSYQVIEKPLMIAAADSTTDPSMVLGNLGAGDNVPAEVAANQRRSVNAIHRELLLSTESGSLLDRLTRNRSLTNREAVDHLFYSFVGRAPNDIERRSGEAILGSRPRSDGLIEIGQVILNSKEYRTQH